MIARHNLQGLGDANGFSASAAVAARNTNRAAANLRRALADVLKDKALLEEAKKAKLVITPVSGEQTTELVDEILSMAEDVKKSLSFLVRTKKS
jgi:predicted Zn-dependent peptidase